MTVKNSIYISSRFRVTFVSNGVRRRCLLSLNFRMRSGAHDFSGLRRRVHGDWSNSARIESR